jgi:hypothetical protein
MENYQRREFIKLSLASFATVALQLNSLSALGLKANKLNGFSGANPSLNWEAFLEEISKLAKTQYIKPWNQSEYIKAVQMVLEQCKFPEYENFKAASANYKDINKDWFEHEALHKEKDFQISLLQFEKEEYISHHDHPSMCGVINMVTGNALVKNYSIHELLEKEETKTYGDKSFVLKSCLIKKENEEILTPNKISTLTESTGNIHSLMPNAFTQLVDIFTPAYSPESEKATKWFTVNENENLERLDKIYEAQYLKM